MLRINVTVSAPDPGLIGRAGALLREGGIAAIPTDTLYGLAVNPFDPAAVAKLFTIKNRAIEKAVPLVASDLNQVRSWIGTLPTIAFEPAIPTGSGRPAPPSISGPYGFAESNG